MAENGISNALTSVFSGADVTVIFGDHYIGECMSFTVGVNREAGPLYVMGRKEPIAIPKGKRGVGGSFILAQLGYDALLKYYKEIMGAQGKDQKIWVRSDEQVPIVSADTRNVGNGAASADILDTSNSTLAKNDLWSELDTPNYVDQMPPFNITIVGVNEQGTKMGMRVYGVVLINDGMAISIDELNIEKRYTFIAQAVSKMQALS